MNCLSTYKTKQFVVFLMECAWEISEAETQQDSQAQLVWMHDESVPILKLNHQKIFTGQ